MIALFKFSSETGFWELSTSSVRIQALFKFCHQISVHSRTFLVSLLNIEKICTLFSDNRGNFHPLVFSNCNLKKRQVVLKSCFISLSACMKIFEKVSNFLYFKVWENSPLPYSFYKYYSFLDFRFFYWKKKTSNTNYVIICLNKLKI